MQNFYPFSVDTNLIKEIVSLLKINLIQDISMAKQTPLDLKATSKKRPQSPVKILYLVMLISYGFVTVLTPNLKALDSNGPKFLTLALLNLVVFLVLFTRNDWKTHRQWYYSFFSTGIGIAYCAFMILSLLSFLKAFNILESILHFSKIFTTFSAVYLVSILIMADRRNILYLSIAMTFLLIFDSITIFSDIFKYIKGTISSILDIKSVYSNKNMLAASVFIKIPFALWLIIYSRKRLRMLGFLGTFLAITATFFISSRAFYFGLSVLIILIPAFFILRYIQTHDKFQLKLSGIFVSFILLAFFIFSFVQHYLYPKTEDAKDRSVVNRIVSATDGYGGGRYISWKWSWHVFKENPLLGVGLGNWKIATLKEENLTAPDFKYQYKAHNDFIEVTAETGIFGGLLFLSIFIMLWWIFIWTLFKNPSSEWLGFLFLPAFGLLCYSIDAFFNFPQDRPEIQALFAIFLGMAIAVIYENSHGKPAQNNAPIQSSLKQRLRNILHKYSAPIQSFKSGNSHLLLALIITFGLMLIATTYILFLNFNTLKLERIVKEDILRGKLTHPASMFINEFPFIPNITIEGEPIAVYKARYLINESQYDEAIKLLKNDNSNPYDSRKEFFLAMAYNNKNILDSSIVYSQKVYKLKPSYFKNISLLCNQLQQSGKQKEGEFIIDNYLSTNKSNKEAWLYACAFYEISGNLQKAVTIIDSAANNLPNDTLVLKNKALLHRKAVIIKHKTLLDKASIAFNTKKYSEALQYYSELLIKEPDFTEARSSRAFCYYFLKEYHRSNQDLQTLISSGVSTPNLYNLQGVNYKNIGNTDEACKYFKIAADKGDKDGTINYSRFCKDASK